MRKLTSKLLLCIALLSPSGCSSFQKEIDNSHLTMLTESTASILKDPKVSEYIKEYLPNGKPELSYKTSTKNTKTRIFIEPKISLKEDMNYGLNLGYEFKY